MDIKQILHEYRSLLIYDNLRMEFTV